MIPSNRNGAQSVAQPVRGRERDEEMSPYLIRNFIPLQYQIGGRMGICERDVVDITICGMCGGEVIPSVPFVEHRTGANNVS